MCVVPANAISITLFSLQTLKLSFMFFLHKVIHKLYGSNLILMDLCENGSNNADSRANTLLVLQKVLSSHVDGRLREARLNHP
jgi:hypothetical protein